MVSPVGAPRFVAGFPLRYGEVPVGVVCLLDEQPGQLDQADFGFMQALCGVISAVVSGIETPPRRDSLLMRRRALEAVLRSEFDRAARLNLTVHLFVFSSSTPPPYLFAERTLIAELGDGSFGMVVTRDSRDRSPPDLVSTIQRLSALPGFGTGNLVSIEMRAAPRIEADYVLHIAERRVVERADPDGAIHRIVVHVEPLAGLNPFGPRVTSASSST
jgi:hypothetical protein